MKNDTRFLSAKATASLRRAAQAYSSLDDDGRTTTVLLHTQHAFEMLLKAILVERGRKVFDAKARRSIGFGRCLAIASDLGVSKENLGTMRVIDAMRDDEQHWLGGCDEAPLLYLHMRASVTTFDGLLQRFFGETLASQLPTRVLPISTEAPRAIDLLVDEQFTQIQRLLRPGRRSRSEARQRIRSLLALEGHVAEEVAVSERDVDRVERGIRQGTHVSEVFPPLQGLESTTSGSGLTVQVKFTRRSDGIPVRTVREDDPVNAAAIRSSTARRTWRTYYVSPRRSARLFERSLG